MKRISIVILILLYSLLNAVPLTAQESPPVGSIKIIGQTRITGSRVVLDRKRFYLLRGGFEEHESLIERLKTTQTITRDCFYSNLKVSPQFMCWLKTEDYNCESPYCREITMEDVNHVPEFLTAHQRGMRQFGGRSEIARDWLTTNLPFDLREGFYRQQKSAINSLLPYANPIQTIMTDTILGTAFFVDIKLNLEGEGDEKKKTETFLITNLLPVEIGDKSYLWVCEQEVGDDKQATFNLQASEKSKRCMVLTKDLPVCKTDGCEDDK